MTSTTVVTMTKMMERLPEAVQRQALEQLRQFIADIQDEQTWDGLFDQTQNQLVAAARQARKEIAAGLAKPLNAHQL